MKILNNIGHTLSILAVLGTMGITSIASAHDAPCPYCKLKLVQSTKTQDNEVVLKVGNKRVEYRCMYCVIKDQGKYKGDLVVYAPSETKGKPVVLNRTDGKWSAPEGTVFLNSFKKHADCSKMSRAFSSKEALDHYAKDHDLSAAKALNELLSIRHMSSSQLFTIFFVSLSQSTGTVTRSSKLGSVAA